MNASSLRRTVWVAGALAAAGAVSCSPSATPGGAADSVSLSSQAEADLIRSTERERLRALVQADTVVARRLHADDFQLINPFGGSLSKDQYLGGIASGVIDYLVWEPDSIAVRVYGPAALIRYQSQLEIVVQGQRIPRARYWHTDSYEKRNGQWQVVWSQATAIR
jgi:hypothetical protein